MDTDFMLKMIRMGIRIPMWQKEALDKLARRDGRTATDLIRQEISKFLKNSGECPVWTEDNGGRQ